MLPSRSGSSGDWRLRAFCSQAPVTSGFQPGAFSGSSTATSAFQPGRFSPVFNPDPHLGATVWSTPDIGVATENAISSFSRSIVDDEPYTTGSANDLVVTSLLSAAASVASAAAELDEPVAKELSEPLLETQFPKEIADRTSGYGSTLGISESISIIDPSDVIRAFIRQADEAKSSRVKLRGEMPSFHSRSLRMNWWSPVRRHDRRTTLVIANRLVRLLEKRDPGRSFDRMSIWRSIFSGSNLTPPNVVSSIGDEDAHCLDVLWYEYPRSYQAFFDMFSTVKGQAALRLLNLELDFEHVSKLGFSSNWGDHLRRLLSSNAELVSTYQRPVVKVCSRSSPGQVGLSRISGRTMVHPWLLEPLRASRVHSLDVEFPPLLVLLHDKIQVRQAYFEVSALTHQGDASQGMILDGTSSHQV